jgi:hypothetical protein
MRAASLIVVDGLARTVHTSDRHIHRTPLPTNLRIEELARTMGIRHQAPSSEQQSPGERETAAKDAVITTQVQSASPWDRMFGHHKTSVLVEALNATVAESPLGTVVPPNAIADGWDAMLAYAGTLRIKPVEPDHRDQQMHHEDGDERKEYSENDADTPRAHYPIFQESSSEADDSDDIDHIASSAKRRMRP